MNLQNIAFGVTAGSIVAGQAQGYLMHLVVTQGHPISIVAWVAATVTVLIGFSALVAVPFLPNGTKNTAKV